MKTFSQSAALAILVSLGVTACGSSGGGGSSSPATSANDIKQIEALKRQVQAETGKTKAETAAKQQAQQQLAQAQRDLATAQKNVADANKRVQAETAKTQAETAAKQEAQQQLAQAQRDLAAAQKNVADANKRVQAETAKTQAETTAKQQAQQQLAQAQRDLAVAQKNVADANKRVQAETAKTQAETTAKQEAERQLAEAQGNLETAQAEIEALKAKLAPFEAEEARKRELAEAEERKWAFLQDGEQWRYIKRGLNPATFFNYEEGKPESYIVLKHDGKASSWILQQAVNFNQKPVGNDVHTLPVMATKQKRGKDTEVHIADAHFVNQPYSTYVTWSYVAENLGSNDLIRSSSYIALPTSQYSKYLDTATIATYQGKALSHNYQNEHIKMGNFSLTANFETDKVSGEITNLGTENYVLEQGDISISQQGNLKFSGRIRTDIQETYSGIFAGPNAEEVVGATSSNRISFGGKR